MAEFQVGVLHSPALPAARLTRVLHPRVLCGPSPAGAGLSPEQLLTFSNAKSEFWLYLVEMLAKLAEHPDLQVGCVP